MLTKTESPAAPSPGFWVVCDDPGGFRDPLVVRAPGLGGGGLAVFSFEEEAQLYLRLRGGYQDGAHPRPTRVSRAVLLALLVGRWAGHGWVALDPIPELDAGNLLPLTTTSREDFVSFLVARRNATRRPRAAAL